MRRIDIPLGAVDALTLAPSVGTVRDALNVVPVASGNGAGNGGYAVPSPAEALGFVSGRTVLGVFASPLESPSADGNGLVIVTDADVREVTAVVPNVDPQVDPEFTTRVLYTFGAADTGREVQGVQLARGGLYLTTQRADGTPEPVLSVTGRDATTTPPVSGQSSLVVRELVAGLPETVVNVTQAPAPFGKGVDPGIYAWRLARRMPDGSLGPATAPVLLTVGRTAEVQRPYFVGVAATRGDETVRIDPGVGTGLTAADIVAAFEEALGKQGGAVPMMMGSLDVEVADCSLVGGNAVVSLVEPLDADVAYGRACQFGKGVKLTFVRVGAAPTGPDGRDERCVVLLSAPLGPGARVARPAFVPDAGTGSVKAQFVPDRVEGSGVTYSYEGAAGGDAEASFASPYFELGEVGEDSEALSVLEFDGTVGDVLAGRSYTEGHLGNAALLARRITELGGRLVLGGVARDLSGPTIPGAEAGAGTLEVIASVRIETTDGERLVWSVDDATTGARRATGDVTFVPYYPDARANEMVIYSRTWGSSDAFEQVGRFVLRPLGVLAGAGGKEVTVDLSSTISTEAPASRDDTWRDDAPDGVLVTGFARPYEWLAERMQVFSRSGGACMGFVSLATAVERERRAEFALVGFWRGAVRGAVVSETGEVLRWDELDEGRGALGFRSFCSYGRRIFYASDDGIRQLGRGGALSGPVVAIAGARRYGPTLDLSDGVSMAVCQTAGRDELWVSDTSNVWVLDVSDLRRVRWSRLGRALAFIQKDPGGGIGGSGGSIPFGVVSGTVRREADTAATRGDDFEIELAGAVLAEGAVTRWERLAMAGVLACPVTVQMLEAEHEDAAPGERVSLNWREASGVLIEPGGERTVRYRSRQTALRVASASDVTEIAPKVGDRIQSFVVGVASTVRRRRHRSILQ